MKTPTTTTMTEKKKAAALHSEAAIQVLERAMRDLEIAASLFHDSAKFSQEIGAYSQQAADAKVTCESVKTRLREIKERHAKSEAAAQSQAAQVATFSAMAARAKQLSETDRAL